MLSLFLSLFFSTVAGADQVLEDFSSRARFSSSTAIWNQASGLLTPKVNLTGWDPGTGAQSTSVNFGTGELGDFDSTTWSQFSTSVDTIGKIIYLDTGTYTAFHFKNFTLPATWTIKPSGNNPLVLYVLGNMTVDGIISCSGEDGAASTGTGASAVAGSGGQGRCGGAAGGDGGARYLGGTTGNGLAGSTTLSLISGGRGATTTGAGAGNGGGGGGSWTALNIPGTPATVSGAGVFGAQGANSSNPSWSHLLGSAGGGGGSGSSTEAGGGGGGGGGLVILHVAGDLTVGANGYILALGGGGGGSPSASATGGGGGGGGGGGSIQTWVVGTVTLSGVGTDAISARSGTGATPLNGGRGGSGWAGRVWTANPLVAFNNPSGATIAPVTELTAEGNIEYDTSASVEATSTAIDVGSTLPTFNSASISASASAQVTLEFSGSRDNFQSDNSGWVSSANISQLNNKRYLKFRVTINNNSTTVPVTVTSFNVDYSKGTRSDFDMKSSGCGGLTGAGSAGSGLGFVSILMSILMVLSPLGVLISWRTLRRHRANGFP